MKKYKIGLRYHQTKMAFFVVLFLAAMNGSYAQKVIKISSPDGNLSLACNVEEAWYSLSYKGRPILNHSKLGLVREDGDFSKDLKLIKVSRPTIFRDSYIMQNAKKKNITYSASQRIIATQTASGKKMNLIFRISNDGMAFRYEFPEKSTDIKHIISEATTFHFFEGTRAWLQPKTEARSGFEHSNPSYEAHYEMDIPTGKPSPGPNGWIYPALFKYNDTWMLITEAALARTYCGTALQQKSPDNEYKINFPEQAEKIPGGALNPESALPWKTPWRIMAIGSLKTIMESTLGTDLAFPPEKVSAVREKREEGFIKPGKASWSWVIEKDGATIYSVQKKYIDFAANMNWQYCLIDAGWDKSIGYDSIKLLADYAKQKKVGLLLWYNSAGNWNTVPFTPHSKLLTHEDRVREFSRLHELGIKGIKVDFFGGDGQSFINYYQDILEDADTYELSVNFHGATLPRGWQRTYPNLLTTEAVDGYEMITFSQQTANAAPAHMVMCAMVRNVFDPMDFTPMNLYKIPHINRVTSAAFELATSVLFLSGLQHYAETPQGMSHVPEKIKNFLRQLPDTWEEVKFIDGYPGRFYVVARKSGKKWYVAGINGEKTKKQLTLDLSFLKNKKGELIASGNAHNEEPSFEVKRVSIPVDGKLSITLKGNDGFIIVL